MGPLAFGMHNSRTPADVSVPEKRSRAARWLSGNGIEIGALHNPLPVPPGATVQYVDRARELELRRQYPELAAKTMVPVDFVGDAQDLSAIANDCQDFVIANHLLEHLEDPIRGLIEMMRVIRPGGVLYLALPDPRVTFDRNRPLTTIQHVVDEYRSGTEATREAHYVEWVELVESRQVVGAGTGPTRVNELMAQDYSIHFHVWRPDDFLEVLVASRREAGLQAEMVEFMPCDPATDNEYIFVLMKPDGALPAVVPPVPPAASTQDLEDEVTAWRERGLASEVRAEAAETALAAVAGSRSWRITAPLRSARSLIKR